MTKRLPHMASDTHAGFTVLLIGGSPEPSSHETIRRAAAGCDAVVAVDRGFDAASAAGIRCTLFCGDADSVSEAGARAVRRAESSAPGSGAFDVVRYDPHKDDTDLGLALSEIARRWPGAAIRVTCFSGGHPDHALAVLGCLMSWKGSVELVEDGFVGRILSAGEAWTLYDATACRLSFVPLSPGATVSERGMRWELDRERVPLLSDLGISNVVDEDGAQITCHEGVIVVWVFNGYFAGA